MTSARARERDAGRGSVRRPVLLCSAPRVPGLLCAGLPLCAHDSAPTTPLLMDSRASPSVLQSAQILSQLAPIQADHLSYSLTASTRPDIIVPTIPRLATPPRPSRPTRRPSTASSAQDKHTLLPPAPPMGELSHSPSPMQDSAGSSKTRSPQLRDGRRASYEDHTLRDMNRRAHAAVAGLRAEASRLASTGASPFRCLSTASLTVCVCTRSDVLPSPFDPSPTDGDSDPPASSAASTVRDSNMVEPDYDWATFVHAYSMGRWDPLKTPLPPRSHLLAPTLPRTSALDASVGGVTSDVVFDSPVLSSVPPWTPMETPLEAPSSRPPPPEPTGPSAPAAPIPEPQPRIMLPPLHANTPPPRSPSALASSALKPSTPNAGVTVTETAAGPSKPAKGLNIPLNLGPFSHRLRNSFADMRTASSHNAYPHLERSYVPIPPADATATAAAIRLAAARVSVAPLALPSPEHELTDPMRGVTATIPRSHPDHLFPGEVLPLLSPNTVRKTRLSSFWQGTQDVEETPGSSDSDGERDSITPTQEAPRTNSQLPLPAETNSEPHSMPSLPIPSAIIPPATAPVKASAEQSDDDYFGCVDFSPVKDFVQSSAPVDPLPPVPNIPSAPLTRGPSDVSRQVSAPPLDLNPQTVPALPRRICLTRQTSAPLPTATLYERRLRASRPPSSGSVNTLAGRAAKEEQMYQELGYLAPPNPPNELERRRALYKFNIWNTGRDSNFDRIAHLVKLVFNTRIVMIALVDGTEQFMKAECEFPMTFA